MKLLIASDLHGSSYYAQKLIEAFIYHKADKILFLGDVLYHGPRNNLPKDYNPKEVINILTPYSNYFIACRGNCDAEVDQMVLPNIDIMSTYQILNLDNITLYCSHGHIYNPDNLPNGKYDVFVYGHTHIPVNYKNKDLTIFNPGSITLPKQNHPNTYGIYQNNQFKLYTLDHNEYQI